jgi:hypothetical protein
MEDVDHEMYRSEIEPAALQFKTRALQHVVLAVKAAFMSFAYKQMQMMLWCNKWRSRTTINNINKFPVREAPTTSYSSRSTEAMLCPSPCQEKWAKGRCVTDLRFSPHRQAGMIFHAAVLAHPLAAESCSNMFKRVLIIVSA